MNWIKTPGWTGPDAVLYRSFDSNVGLMFMEGTEQKDQGPLVSRKVRKFKKSSAVLNFPNMLFHA